MNEVIPVLNTELDQSDMRGAIIDFPDQIIQSLSIIKKTYS